MEAEIIENVGKVKKEFRISINSAKNNIESREFLGDTIWIQLDKFFKQKSNIISQVKTIRVFNRFHDIDYISKFINVENISIKAIYSPTFSKLNKLLKVKSISLNQSKPTKLKGISLIPNLKELRLGDFSFGKPFELIGTDEIINCKNIETLFISNVKIHDKEIRKLSAMKNLKILTLFQQIEVDTLAYLSVHLPNTISNELKAWQKCSCSNGDIKINGKRRPYLWKSKDKDKILKYESEFNKLRNKYLKN